MAQKVAGCRLQVAGCRLQVRVLLGSIAGKLRLFTEQQRGYLYKYSEKRGMGSALHMLCPRHGEALITGCPYYQQGYGIFTFISTMY